MNLFQIPLNTRLTLHCDTVSGLQSIRLAKGNRKPLPRRHQVAQSWWDRVIEFPFGPIAENNPRYRHGGIPWTVTWWEEILK